MNSHNYKLIPDFLVLTFIILFAGFVQAEPIKNSYIVVLNPYAGMPEQVAQEVAKATNGRIGYVYNHALQGFSITLPPQALPAIINNPNFASIEPDITVQVFEQVIPTGISRIFSDIAMGDGVDDRVDADVAVLDTGIDWEHNDLNVVDGVNCLSFVRIRGRYQYYCDETMNGDDDHYHGTHVAGIIGALDNGYGVVGVAPGVRLWAVKVLDYDGSGALSGIIAGIDWVVGKGDVEVINMSLGGAGTSSAMNEAVENAVTEGVTVVVSAGNEDDDAANYTPANAPYAITVSALADFDGLAGYISSSTCRTDEDDTLANFSNWGATVDIAAPGVCIKSTYPIEHGDYGTISGTSMAAPYVAGAASLLASNGYTPADIKQTLLAKGNFDWADDSYDGVQEPLLDISDDAFDPILAGSSPPPVNNPPIANFNYSDDGLTVTFMDASSDSDGSITTWLWSFGDGATSTSRDYIHTYNGDGTYIVTLTVTDNEGASDTTGKDITVSSALLSCDYTDRVSCRTAGCSWSNRTQECTVK